MVKNPPANAGDRRDSGSIPGSGRSPRGGYGNPVQYFCLGNLKDRGTWQAMVHGFTKTPKGRIRSNLICKHMCGHAHVHTHTHTHTHTLRQGCLAPQFSSITQSCPTLCNPMGYSTLGFPVHHQLPELAHTYHSWSW